MRLRSQSGGGVLDKFEDYLKFDFNHWIITPMFFRYWIPYYSDVASVGQYLMDTLVIGAAALSFGKFNKQGNCRNSFEYCKQRWYASVRNDCKR